MSHCMERTARYYVPVMAGATVAYARSVQQLQEDLALIRPTVLISVPRIFERIQAGIRSKSGQGSGFDGRSPDNPANPSLAKNPHQIENENEKAQRIRGAFS